MTDVREVPPPTVQPELVPPGAGHETLRARMAAHWAQPFYRNAYSLLLNTGLTGVLGLAYWALAARNYDATDVGRGSATISVMMLLSGAVAFNLMGTLTRFVGQSGPRAGRFVAAVYVSTIVAVTGLSAAFLATLDLWGPAYAHLGGLSTGLWFTGAVIAAAVVTLQDAVLMGLRRSPWVPAANVAFGVVKLILLLAFAVPFARDGVWLSWVIPMALLAVPVNTLIFGRLLPRHVRTAPGGTDVPSRRVVGRFVAADFVGALCLFATIQLIPVLVSTEVPVDTFGYFYVTWTVGTMLNLVAVNVATSLTVEGVYDATKLAANCRAAVGRTTGLLLIAVITLCLGAPYGMGLLGPGYVEAVPLLQLLALSALPKALTEIHLGILRAQSASQRIARLQILRGVLVVGSVVAALKLDASWREWGVSTLTGVGLAVLIGQGLVAVLVLPGLRRTMRLERPAMESRGGRAVSQTTTEPAPSAGPPTGPGTAEVQPPRRRPFGRAWPAVAWLATAAAIPLFVLPLRGVDLARVDGLGLVSVLPILSFVGAGLLTMTFVLTLALGRPRRVLLGAQVVLTVALLHGLPVLLETVPRFATAWVHMGFVEYITRTGAPAPDLDARFSWPGFFAFWSFLIDADGWRDLAWVVQLMPVVSNLLYLLPLAVILRSMRADWRARWLALWLFPVLNWVGQDYFSPQGLAYLLHLAVLAVVISVFSSTGPIPRHLGGALWRRMPWPSRRPFTTAVAGELPAQRVPVEEKVALLLLVLLMFTVIVASHQLTPVLTTAACVALLLAGRLSLRGLPVIMTVIFVGYVSFMAAAYWSGHLDLILGGIGQLADNVSSSVTDRADAGDPEHTKVLNARIISTLGVFVLAAAGALRRRWRGYDDRVMLALLASPFVTVLMQSYGGEIGLRVYFFALPAAALLMAYLFFPRRLECSSTVPRRLGACLAAGVCALVLVGGFFVTRYGNEAFERVRPGEVAALDHVYEQMQGDVRVMWLNSEVVTGSETPAMANSYRDMERVDFWPEVAPRDPEDVAPVVDRLEELGPDGLLITTRAQEAHLVVTAQYPADWGDRFRAELARTSGVRIVVANPDAVVYEATQPDPDPTVSAAVSTTRIFFGTPLTAAGVGCLVGLLGVLLAREVRRLMSPSQSDARLRSLTWAAVLLAVGLMVVVIERLVLLA
jgi:O-antigen/teichoic acid export membrane protein